ncbi:unnamed protein product [Lupinus luteus]|uniref:Uncharacterized protein n=1 Tax=Lupinus luteus TaxID=3873 RepID=A0AAV1Y5F0_LUPLU
MDSHARFTTYKGFLEWDYGELDYHRSYDTKAFVSDKVFASSSSRALIEEVAQPFFIYAKRNYFFFIRGNGASRSIPKGGNAESIKDKAIQSERKAKAVRMSPSQPRRRRRRKNILCMNLRSQKISNHQ